MKKLTALVAALLVAFVAMPAQATMTYVMTGLFGQYIPAENNDGPDTYLDPVIMAFSGVSDDSAPTIGSYVSGDGETGFDYSRFALSSFVIQMADENGDPIDQVLPAGNDYFFWTAPTMGYAGFGKGSTLLVGGFLTDPEAPCECGGDEGDEPLPPAIIAYDGTTPAAFLFDGGSIDDPIVFNGEGHLYDFAYGLLLADDGSLFESDVPEPASWALMLAGFGMTGAAIRRRRATLAPAA